jgi:hypothetical protein
MARFQPTDEQLRQAFTRLQRPGWPASLADTLQDPVRAALLRGDAARHAIGLPPRRTGTRPAVVRALPAAHFDRKRAAAGDRDDD